MSSQPQAQSRKRTETPPPKAKETPLTKKEQEEKAAKIAKEKKEKDEHSTRCAALGFIMAIASVCAVKMYYGYFSHRHADGSLDWFGDTDSVCYQSGEKVSSFFTIPIYYSGMMTYGILFAIGKTFSLIGMTFSSIATMVYTVLSPLIWIASEIYTGLRWIMSILTYPLVLLNRLTVWIWSIPVKVCLWLLSWPYRFIMFCAGPLLAFLISFGHGFIAGFYAVITPFVALASKAIAGVIALIPLSFIATFWWMSSTVLALLIGFGMFALTFLAVLAGVAYIHGTDRMISVLMPVVVCPAQLSNGISASMGEAFEYWTPVVAMLWSSKTMFMTASHFAVSIPVSWAVNLISPPISVLVGSIA